MAALAAFSISTAMAAGHCTLQMIGTFPVDMQGLHPLVAAQINGVKVRFLLDTGDFYNLMWRNAATRYQLPVTPVRGGPIYVENSAGNTSTAEVATISSFHFPGLPPSKAQFLVVNGLSDDPAGLIGENLLKISDVEYDLANGIARFFKPVNCNGQSLAYWAVSTPYTSVKLHNMDVTDNHLAATAMINGSPMIVWLDTGATRSLLSLQAAERLGITPASPGVTPLGAGGGGSEMWIAPVDSFELGGEKIEHAHLLIGRFEPQKPYGYVGYNEFPDMILGEDFFLSHRIYVAYSQNEIYFTYNGGPLFNLNLPQVLSGKEQPPATLDANATTAAGAQAASNVPTDADGLRRQGLAFAATHQFDRALADLTRACQLAPTDATNHFDRGMIYRQDGQPKSALADFDAAIGLRPDDIDAHLARAQLLLSQPDVDPGAVADIKSDLDAVSRLAAPTAYVHLTLGGMYGRLGYYSAAVSQIDEWLDSHPLEGDQSTGFNSRCYLRARTNHDLTAALDDCNHALKLVRNDSGFLDSRGLVYLRLGRPRDAISDYDRALRMDPNRPSALYGRGLAELRLGKKPKGQADLAAAEKLDSAIANYFSHMGLVP
jgi:tetratricopeptide (TPR) repeat protein/predicted aspartyl protease